MVRISEMKQKEKALAAVSTAMKMLSNQNRLRILNSLHERPKTWTELMFELRMNPKTLQHHLSCLRENKLVSQNKPHGFKLTEYGKSLIELSVRDVMSTVQKATEIVGRRRPSKGKETS